MSNTISKRYDAVATVGTYTDRSTGQKKKQYRNVGTLLEYADGRLSLKLEAIPITPEWSGWLAFYESKPQATASRPVPPSDPEESISDDDDLPF